MKNFSTNLCEYVRVENPSYKITWNHSKNIIFSVFRKFVKYFSEYKRMENLNYKNENIERKYLKNMWKNQFLKVKNSLLELEKYFIKVKEKELKDREEKIKREIGELFFKPIIVPIDDMDNSEQKEMKKIRPIKNAWYDWLVNYIPEPIRKSVGGFKDKIVSLFKTNAPKQTVYGRGRKLRKPKIQNIRNAFILKKNEKRN